jgi:hypothetical protein
MKVQDFTGKRYNWPPNGYSINFDDIRQRSQYHLECRRLLHEIYPLDRILEEVPLPGIGLFLDFFTPHNYTAYEVNGEQHEEYNSFFYKTKGNFLRAKNNDKRKQEWCQLNNIHLIILDYKDIENWKEIILG